MLSGCPGGSSGGWEDLSLGFCLFQGRFAFLLLLAADKRMTILKFPASPEK